MALKSIEKTPGSYNFRDTAREAVEVGLLSQEEANKWIEKHYSVKMPKRNRKARQDALMKRGEIRKKFEDTLNKSAELEASFADEIKNIPESEKNIIENLWRSPNTSVERKSLLLKSIHEEIEKKAPPKNNIREKIKAVTEEHLEEKQENTSQNNQNGIQKKQMDEQKEENKITNNKKKDLEESLGEKEKITIKKESAKLRIFKELAKRKATTEARTPIKLDMADEGKQVAELEHIATEVHEGTKIEIKQSGKKIDFRRARKNVLKKQMQEIKRSSLKDKAKNFLLKIFSGQENKSANNIEPVDAEKELKKFNQAA